MSFARQELDLLNGVPLLKQLLKGPEDVPRQLSMLVWPIVAATLHAFNGSCADELHGNWNGVSSVGHGRRVLCGVSLCKMLRSSFAVLCTYFRFRGLFFKRERYLCIAWHMPCTQVYTCVRVQNMISRQTKISTSIVSTTVGHKRDMLQTAPEGKCKRWLGCPSQVHLDSCQPGRPSPAEVSSASCINRAPFKMISQSLLAAPRAT